METSTILIIGIVIVALISISAGIISVVAISKSNQSSEIQQLQKNMDEFKTSIEKVVVSQAQALNTGTRGLQGPRGPSGPQGPPGMDYSAAGQLLNMATKTVATPTAGQGEQSIVYLDNKNYAPFQYWFLENTPDKNGVRVKNKMTGFCLKTDDKKNVFSKSCTRDFGDPDERFNWDTNMKLRSIGQGGKCMTIKQNFQRGAGVSNESYDPNDGSAMTNSNKDRVNRIELEDCSSSINPNQTWFVGS